MESSRKRCQNWIQSGCPLSTDMLIHLCGISSTRQQAMRGNFSPSHQLFPRLQCWKIENQQNSLYEMKQEVFKRFFLLFKSVTMSLPTIYVLTFERRYCTFFFLRQHQNYQKSNFRFPKDSLDSSAILEPTAKAEIGRVLIKSQMQQINQKMDRYSCLW